jgi:beta-lactamase class A
MLERKIPLFFLPIAIITGIIASYLLFQIFHQNPALDTSAKTSSVSSMGGSDYSFERLKGYKHIRPLVWVRPIRESEKYSATKSQMIELIQGYVQSGVLNSASFDLRDLKEGDWVSYNSDEKFSPGSLTKVLVMITILRMAEDKPGLLDQVVDFDKPFAKEYNDVFPDITIKLGEKYTIRQLVQRMIQYSDNYAKDFLCAKLEPTAFKKVFTDFGFPEGNLREVYPISSAEYSAYMESLYNAGYLTIQDSEYAMALLASCNFKQGMVSVLPDSIVVAHKFGESGDAHMQQLHESGIVYYGDSPYLLTVMTKGPDIKKLPEVISAISRIAYNNINSSSKMAQTSSVSH